MPVNHWQAEDRAYRIGQTGTVNVTYMVGRDTVDTFVRTVLETKADLIDQMVEGSALPEDFHRDVMGEMRRIMDVLQPGVDTLSENKVTKQFTHFSVRVKHLSDDLHGQSHCRYGWKRGSSKRRRSLQSAQ